MINSGRHSQHTGRQRLRLLALGLVLVAVTACTPIYRNHGYAPSEDELAEIVVGVDTRETVADLIGSPSASGVLRDSGYYYVSQRIRTFATRRPQVVERQVVAITFDDEGVVRNVERFGLEDGNVVALERRVTDSNIEGITFIRQLLGNIGRFTAEQILGQ